MLAGASVVAGGSGGRRRPWTARTGHLRRSRLQNNHADNIDARVDRRRAFVGAAHPSPHRVLFGNVRYPTSADNCPGQIHCLAVDHDGKTERQPGADPGDGRIRGSGSIRSAIGSSNAPRQITWANLDRAILNGSARSRSVTDGSALADRTIRFRAQGSRGQVDRSGTPG